MGLDGAVHHGEPEPAGPCWCALDTSSVADLAALVAYWPETGAVQCWFWTPEATLVEREHSDRAPYTVWAREGLLLTTAGRTIDLRAPCPLSGFPVPESFEALAMPPKDRLRLNHLSHTKQARPELGHPYEQCAVTAA